MKNGIVIPCYNEANRLQFDQFRSFLEENKSYTLCFVNDGSKDETLSQLEDFSKNTARVMVVNLTENMGKAEAVRQGVQQLLMKNEFSTVGYLDADLATGFDDYMRLTDLLRVTRKSMVFGSRKMEESGNIDRSFLRDSASKLIGKFIHLIIGMPIKDTQCGAKVFTNVTASYLFSKSFMSRWLFDVELFIRMKALYQEDTLEKLTEVPLNSWEEVEGSKITLRESLKFPIQLAEIGYAYRLKPQLVRTQNPYSLGTLDGAA